MATKDTAFEASDAQGPEAVEEGVRALAESPLAGEPGAAFRFASANFSILGLLVQTVSGQQFGDYLEEHVFGTLEMARSHPTRADPRARFLLTRRPAPAGKRRAPLALATAALALDGFALWLCLIYAPARFDTHLFVIVRQFPDVGVSLVPVLALAILWPVPRTVWLSYGTSLMSSPRRLARKPSP
jgi:CubicO group peptidase (beta-lactamase class C family)